MVTIDDPEGLIQVTIVGEKILIAEKKNEDEPIKVSAGEHKLHIQRGELKFETDKFTLGDGERVRLMVQVCAKRRESRS